MMGERGVYSTQDVPESPLTVPALMLVSPLEFQRSMLPTYLIHVVLLHIHAYT